MSSNSFTWVTEGGDHGTADWGCLAHDDALYKLTTFTFNFFTFCYSTLLFHEGWSLVTWMVCLQTVGHLNTIWVFCRTETNILTTAPSFDLVEVTEICDVAYELLVHWRKHWWVWALYFDADAICVWFRWSSMDSYGFSACRLRRRPQITVSTRLSSLNLHTVILRRPSSTLVGDL